MQKSAKGLGALTWRTLTRSSLLHKWKTAMVERYHKALIPIKFYHKALTPIKFCQSFWSSFREFWNTDGWIFRQTDNVVQLNLVCHMVYIKWKVEKLNYDASSIQNMHTFIPAFFSISRVGRTPSCSLSSTPVRHRSSMSLPCPTITADIHVWQ